MDRHHRNRERTRFDPGGLGSAVGSTSSVSWAPDGNAKKVLPLLKPTRARPIRKTLESDSLPCALTRRCQLCVCCVLPPHSVDLSNDVAMDRFVSFSAAFLRLWATIGQFWSKRTKQHKRCVWHISREKSMFKIYSHPATYLFKDEIRLTPQICPLCRRVNNYLVHRPVALAQCAQRTSPALQESASWRMRSW